MSGETIDHHEQDVAEMRAALQRAGARFVRRAGVRIDRQRNELVQDIVHELRLPKAGTVGRVSCINGDWQGFAFGEYVESNRNPERVKASVFRSVATIWTKARVGTVGGGDLL